MKNKIEVEKVIIVTKDNFKTSLEEFKKLLNSKILDYIILNNDISTSNPKIQDKEGEIVFSEFTFCQNVNYQGKDINYKFTTFLVPSIKFHRYAVDEIASFNSIFLKYLTNEKSLYDFNLINAANSLSYDNIHKRKEFEKNLNLILESGKPFKKENKTSYYYYPKAFELPSKKYQKKFEEYLKYFLEQNFDENAKKIEIEDKSTFLYESDKYVSDFKFLNNFLDFKWGQIYEKMDYDMYRIFVNEYKIKFNSDVKFSPDFLIFAEKLKNLLQSEQSIDNFVLKINQNEENDLNEELLKNWRQYIMAEENVADFSYEYIEKNQIKFELKADKSKEKEEKFPNLVKYLNFLISVPNEISSKKEFEVKQIFYRRINMKNLFPDKIRNNIEFNYHLISRIDKDKFKLEKNKDYYLSKISYKRLFINKKNEEEILFGYKIEPQLKLFLEVKNEKKDHEELNQPKTKSISLELGKDLEILIKDEEFKKIINGYYSNIKISKENEQNKFRTVNYNLVKIPKIEDKNFKNDFDSMLKRAKIIKKNNLLDEEIGITYFYDAIFKKEDINIYGTNLKHKLYFPIKQLLLEQNKNNEKEIQNILNKVNIYDISYINIMKENINFFQKYLNLKKDEELKERTITQRLGYVIEETDFLKDRENLAEYKNKFYFDEKDKVNKKHYICVAKDKLYEKPEEIISIFKEKTDFTICKNDQDNNIFEINIIDYTKYDEIENIGKAVESC